MKKTPCKIAVVASGPGWTGILAEERLTLEFTAVIEKSCRHVRVRPQERPPLQQSRGEKGLQDQSVSPHSAHIFLVREASISFKEAMSTGHFI
ncbi:hypothetical protein AMELA_G00181310 [Ameiurus melas]|uniref:Uncharacterized protein n=1 Tax=Ameiurus melas TaxID=219545 RepID=A0A7J6ACG3_AMEME|nr:hypothetical protein AMELA_G00181310 [Ameiurus melas]